MSSPKRRAVYDEFLKVPAWKVAEIIDGELVVTPRPATPQGYAGGVLFIDIGGAFGGPPPGAPERPGGWWILYEPELHLVDDVLVPDFAGWRRERLPVLPAAPFVPQAPDWVCEVLSPSTTRIDRTRKMRIYAREGIAHLWLVDPAGADARGLPSRGGPLDPARHGRRRRCRSRRALRRDRGRSHALVAADRALTRCRR